MVVEHPGLALRTWWGTMSAWSWISSDSFRRHAIWLLRKVIWDSCNWLHCLFGCTPLWLIEVLHSWFCNCCSRRMEKSVWETGRQVHTMLFLQERDYWHESGMHKEYLLGKMLCSAEYAGDKERWCQSVHSMWSGWSPSRTRRAPEAG